VIPPDHHEAFEVRDDDVDADADDGGDGDGDDGM
jgi:hypothetical protein